MGYHRAGFEVVGVDINPQPHYPFEFHRGDALAALAAARRPTFGPFDVIHASPPCQRYSDLAARNGNAAEHPDLVGVVRESLLDIMAPWVIENVEGAPLRNPVWLCGTMFPGLRVLRHRQFEFWDGRQVETPPHRTHPLCYTMDKRKSNYGKGDPFRDFVHVNGGGNAPVAAKLDAMGIDWPMTGREVNEAIPPAYAEWIGTQLMAALRVAA